MKVRIKDDFYLGTKKLNKNDEIDLTDEQAERFSGLGLVELIADASVKSMDSPPKDKMIRKSNKKGGIRG